MGSGPGKCKKIFGKGACGNVPGPKTFFSKNKKRCLRQCSNTKNAFVTKKSRLRQRSRTKNVFFHQKKAPAATLQEQKHVFYNKKQMCLRQGTRTKNTFFHQQNAPAARDQDQKTFFADRGLSNCLLRT